MLARTTMGVAVSAGLAVSFGAFGQAGVSSGDPREGAVSGRAAIERLRAGLGAAAAEHGMSAAELAALLVRNPSLFADEGGRLFYACVEAPRAIQEAGLGGSGDEGGTVAGRGALGPGGIPLDDFMSLNSLPGASKTIYMDVDGHHSVSNSWGHNIVFPAYNTQGDSTFSDAEKSDIIAHWLEVVEDFRQFNVNVTTQDPGLDALRKSSGSDTAYGIRCVMTQATSGFGDGIGGVAFLNSFDDSIDNPCFAFNKGLGAGPMTVSHEVGHALGLSHDGLNGQEYHPGAGGGGFASWGPIMGAPFGREIVQWSNGDYPGSSTTQDDYTIITKPANGFGFLADDITNDFFNGVPLSAGINGTGYIGTRTDVDVFRFTAGDEQVVVSAEPADVGPNVDILLEVYRLSPFGQLASVNALNLASSSATLDLTAGEYIAVIDGSFQTGSNGAVSDYGSTGSYTVRFDPVIPPTPITISFPNGVPTQLDEGVATTITVEIDPGSFAINAGTAAMFYSFNFPVPIETVALSPIGGNLYTADLPAGACDDTALFQFFVADSQGDPLFSPANSLEYYGATVVCAPPSCLADVNGDGAATPADFSAWVSAFNAQGPGCDQNGDGACTPADFSSWITNFNAGC